MIANKINSSALCPEIQLAREKEWVIRWHNILFLEPPHSKDESHHFVIDHSYHGCNRMMEFSDEIEIWNFQSG